MIRTEAVESPRAAEREEAALAVLLGRAEAGGVVAVPVRELAKELGVTTVRARGFLRRLVRAGVLREIGLGVQALEGTPAATLDDEPDLQAPRTRPHRALHDGTGSPLLW